MEMKKKCGRDDNACQQLVSLEAFACGWRSRDVPAHAAICLESDESNHSGSSQGGEGGDARPSASERRAADDSSKLGGVCDLVNLGDKVMTTVGLGSFVNVALRCQDLGRAETDGVRNRSLELDVGSQNVLRAYRAEDGFGAGRRDKEEGSVGVGLAGDLGLVVQATKVLSCRCGGGR